MYLVFFKEFPRISKIRFYEIVFKTGLMLSYPDLSPRGY